MAAGFESQSFHNISSEVTSHHIGCILFLRVGHWVQPAVKRRGLYKGMNTSHIPYSRRQRPLSTRGPLPNWPPGPQSLPTTDILHTEKWVMFLKKKKKKSAYTIALLGNLFWQPGLPTGQSLNSLTSHSRPSMTCSWPLRFLASFPTTTHFPTATPKFSPSSQKWARLLPPFYNLRWLRRACFPLTAWSYLPPLILQGTASEPPPLRCLHWLSLPLCCSAGCLDVASFEGVAQGPAHPMRHLRKICHLLKSNRIMLEL